MIALCHGTFDLLHLGHVMMFQEAKELVGKHGDVIVTLTADEYVNKGPGRPIFGEWERLKMIGSCRYVDQVEICREPTGSNVIRKWCPDYYVKGADYLVADKHGHLEAERLLVEQLGGRLYIARHAGWSSTDLIRRIREAN